MSKGSMKNEEEEESGGQFDLRRGPWTLDEDNLLIHYIACNGEGRWNTLAKCAGLKRTGKSCRLRWLNYLKPDIKRGNLTPQEQILILELHSKWGNRWSKIAQHLPGRTDNEIKNYWRTRVQKQARQLNVDSNSKKFLEAIRGYWMPRLLEKVEQNSSISSPSSISSISSTIDNHDSASAAPCNLLTNESPLPPFDDEKPHKSSSDWEKIMQQQGVTQMDDNQAAGRPVEFCLNNSAANHSSLVVKDECYQVDMTYHNTELLTNPELSAMESHQDIDFSECQMISEADWFKDVMPETAFWNMDELWHFRKPEVGI